MMQVHIMERAGDVATSAIGAAAAERIRSRPRISVDHI
jgi:hypothetical protein